MSIATNKINLLLLQVLQHGCGQLKYFVTTFKQHHITTDNVQSLILRNSYYNIPVT